MGNHIKTVTDANEPDQPLRVVTFTYGAADAGPELTEVVDIVGGRTNFAYDTDHRMTHMRMPNQYDAAVPVASDPETVRNLYEPGTGRVTSQTDQLGHVTSFDYSIPGSTIVTEPSTLDADGGTVTHRRRDTYQYGLLVTQTKGYNSPDAATWAREYDPVSLGCTRITGPDNKSWLAEYDAAGNRTSTTDPLLRTTAWTWTNENLPATVVDPRGHVSGADPALWTTTFSYDDEGCGCNLRFRSRPLLDAEGTAVVATQTTEYRYGERANHARDLTTVVDPLGKEWTTDYDADGYPATVTDPLTHTMTMEFDRWGRKTSEVSPRGNLGPTPDPAFATTYSHAPDNRLTATSTANPPGPALTSASTYDANRNPATTTDGNGNETRYDYDAANQLTMVDRPGPADLANEYWDDGSLRAQRDGAGEATQYVSDAQGRLATVTDPLGRATSYAYHPVGTRAWKQDPGGNCEPAAGNPKVACTTYGYDDAGQLKTVEYSDDVTPNVVDIVYAPNGARTAMEEQTKVAPVTTAISTWTYDSLDRLVSSNDAAATVGYGYDLGNHLTHITYPGAPGPLERHFDDAGRMDWIQDWAGRRTDFGYDEADNLTTKEFPTAGVVDTLTYDHAGSLDTIAVAKGANPLASFDYSRDGNAQVSAVDSTGVPPDNHTYGYSGLNQLCWEGGPGATGTCQAPPAGGGNYGYDNADNLTRFPSGVTQDFDAANQLESTPAPPADAISAWGTSGDVVVPGAYDGAPTAQPAVFRPSTGTWYVKGRPQVNWGTSGDVAVPADYDGDGRHDVAVFRPASGTWFVKGGQTVGWGGSGDVPVPADYDGDGKADMAVYRPASATWFVQQSSGGDLATTYGTTGDRPVPADYDGDGKTDLAVFRPSSGTWFVHQSSGGDTATAYGVADDVVVPADYDGDGKADIAVFRPAQGLWFVHRSSGGDDAVAYGTAGDIPVPADYDGDEKPDLAVFRPSAGTWYARLSSSGAAYDYDERGNRTSTTPALGPAANYGYDGANRLISAPGATYAYRGDGLRSSKTVGGATTSFTWDESSGLPMLLAEMTAAGTIRYIYGPGGLPLARIDAAGNPVYYHQDQLGSTRALTDQDGNVVATATYSPYGRVTASTGTIAQPFGFAGEYTDSETGFVYLRARYYDPATGQFISRDPIVAITQSAYDYVEGNPLNHTDPLGLWPWDGMCINNPFNQDDDCESIADTNPVADKIRTIAVVVLVGSIAVAGVATVGVPVAAASSLLIVLGGGIAASFAGLINTFTQAATGTRSDPCNPDLMDRLTDAGNQILTDPNGLSPDPPIVRGGVNELPVRPPPIRR